MTDQDKEIQLDQLVAKHMETLKERFPILFTGEEATRAVATIIKETAKQATKAATKMHGQAVYSSMDVILEADLADISSDGGLTEEVCQMLADSPREAFAVLLKSTYAMVMKAVELTAIDGIKVLPDKKTEDPSGLSDEEFFFLNVQKVRGQA